MALLQPNNEINTNLLGEYLLPTSSSDRTNTEYCIIRNALQLVFGNVHRPSKRRQLTVEPLRGRLDKKTSALISVTCEGMIHLTELPSSLQLLIFSYLDVKSLCQVSRTCQQLNSISCDYLLWKKHLTQDFKKANIINYQTHPQVYLDAESELSMKQIYSRCFPRNVCNGHVSSEDTSLTSRLLKFARPFFYPSQPSRLIIFGPGLETQTSGLIYKLLWSSQSPFLVEGMFPGHQDGVGSGVSLRYNDKLINLITLYSSTKKEREASNGNARNRILLEKDDSETEVTEVTHAVRQLCKTVGGFIYVVDSSVKSAKLREACAVLTSMTDERWTVQTAPLLVLSCHFTTDQQHLSCADVTDSLKLCDVNRPWQVNRVSVENLEGIQSAMDWLLSKC